MSGSLKDLNDHLFAQLDRLRGGNLTGDALSDEVKRAEAIVSVSDQITGNAELQLKAAKIYAEHGNHVLPMLPQIGGPSKAEDSEK